MCAPASPPSDPERGPPAAVAADPQALLACARRLQQSELGPHGLPRLLQGRHVALLCADGAFDTPAALLFLLAATGLGAQVARLKPAVDARSAHSLGRMLGRLYDAVECQGMQPELVQALAQAAAVPVFDGLAAPEHRSAALAASLQGAGTDADKRRWLLQASLVEALG